MCVNYMRNLESQEPEDQKWPLPPFLSNVRKLILKAFVSLEGLRLSLKWVPVIFTVNFNPLTVFDLQFRKDTPRRNWLPELGMTVVVTSSFKMSPSTNCELITVAFLGQINFTQS